jgi:membrane protein
LENVLGSKNGHGRSGKRGAGKLWINLKELWTLIKDTFAQWSEDNPFQLAAALAYYTLFSMVPLLMIAIAVAGLVFGREASQNQVIGIIDDLVGVQGARDPGND